MRLWYTKILVPSNLSKDGLTTSQFSKIDKFVDDRSAISRILGEMQSVNEIENLAILSAGSQNEIAFTHTHTNTHTHTHSHD